MASGDKMNWMYKGLSGHVDPEEYLMGRKVDKTFELIRTEVELQKSHFDVDDNVVPPSLLKSGDVYGHSSITGRAIVPNVTVDIESKLREDPLYEIRKKEIEKRKEILLNPVKMKRIQNLLKKSLETDSDSDSSSSSEDERRKKRRKDKKMRERSRSPRRDEKSHRSGHRHGHGRDDSSHRSDSLRNKRGKERSHHGHRRKSVEKRRSKSREKRRSRSKERHSSKDHKKSDGRSSKIKDDKPKDDRYHQLHKQSSASRPSTYQTPKVVQSRPKLSAEELEKKRLEMMKDAVERDKERKERVQKYKEDEAKDNKESESIKPGSFVRPLLKDKIERESIESSVRQKVFSSQRGSHSMDTNFASRR